MIKEIKKSRLPKEVLSLLELLNNPKNHITRNNYISIYYDDVFILFEIFGNIIYANRNYIGNYLNYSYIIDGEEYIYDDITKYINYAIDLSNYSDYKVTIL